MYVSKGKSGTSLLDRAMSKFAIPGRAGQALPGGPIGRSADGKSFGTAYGGGSRFPDRSSGGTRSTFNPMGY